MISGTNLPPEPSRAQRITRGAGWVYSYRWIDRLLGFLSIVVLARILSPADFGLVAIAASYVAVVEGLSDFDVQRALIQSRDEDRALYDSAWTLSLLRGVLAAAVLCAVAQFVEDARITPVLYVLAAAPLFEGAGNPRFVMFERELVYSRLALATLAAKLTSFAVTLSVALVYRSYWALVLGIVAASAVTALLTYALRPYRPHCTLARWRDIVRFSGWMSLANLVTTLSMRTDRIIVGRLLGVSDAGFYYMAQRVGSLPTSELIAPLQRILFPSFSEIANDRARLRAAVSESVNVLGSLSLPVAVGFALVAEQFVPLALGERWVSIVPLLMVLVPFLGLRATLSMTQPCVMALGQTRLLFRVSWLYAVVHLPAFIAGTALYGLPGAMWSIALAGLFYIALCAWLLRQTVAIGPREILQRLRRPLVATLVMAAVLATDLAPLLGSATSLAVLVARVALGALVYGLTLLLLWSVEGRPGGIETRSLAAGAAAWRRLNSHSAGG